MKMSDRGTCRAVMAQWIRELMEVGHMTPTVFAVNLTVAYQRRYGGGEAYDHDRQRLFKSCVSKWKKGVQSPSVENCLILEDVRSTLEADILSAEGANAAELLSRTRALCRPGIIAMRERLDSLPRSSPGHSGSSGDARGRQGQLGPAEAVVGSTLNALLQLLRQVARDVELHRLAQGDIIAPSITEARASEVLSETQKLDRLKRQIGELVLTLLLEQAQDERRA